MPSLTPGTDTVREGASGASSGAAQRPHLGTSRITRPLRSMSVNAAAQRRVRYARRQRSSGWLVGDARERAGLPADATTGSPWVRPLRPARCRWRVAAAVGVHHQEGRGAHWSGLERCSSIWACPVCSAVIRAERAREIQQGADNWAARGATVLMITATTRHYRADPLSVNLDLAMAAWRKLVAHRTWKALKARLGVAGYVRAVEVTWSNANGWHPHIHVLVFARSRLSDAQVAELQGEVFELWQTVVMRSGGRSLSAEHGVRVTRGASADYVAKVQEHDRGTGLEMARLDLKSGRYGSLTPFELLDSAEHRARWLEYVEATHGRRAITWSRGLRDLLELGEEATDEELIEQTETSDLVVLLDGETYDALRRLPARLVELLELAEAGRPPDVITRSALRRERGS